MATLISQLIDLPESVHTGDFVLRLGESLEHTHETLHDYVVTDQLRTAFDQALDLVKVAVEGHNSRAAYLHGSFGSGKSHFMAVLYLLLQRNPDARTIPQLAEILAKHDKWMQGRSFLLVAHHMIGEDTLESAILHAYATTVAKLQPEAPTPAIYLSGEIFDNARTLRADMGDERFFAALNKNRSSGGGDWGDLDAGWDATSFGAACVARPGSADHDRLVGDLVDTVLTAFAAAARSSTKGFVPLDDGLAVISRHAAALGYDGLVLFLDELMLWFLSRMNDLEFVSREGPKVAKLVEASDAVRPIPLISFIARQRDLRDFVGENVPGAEKVSFLDTLKWWEERFDKISLADTNLPVIAHERILRTKTPAERGQLDAAFDEAVRMNPRTLDVLLTAHSDREAFKLVYPFTPAFVETLIGVSGTLQRNRTALKLMQELLVDERDTLELGQVVPVGDLWDLIADGDEAFTNDMQRRFDDAKRYYRQQLVPAIEERHRTTLEAYRAADPASPAARKFREDLRLFHTLLLAALVPEVDALRALTPERLTALNHGTFTSPIKGQEAADILQRLRRYGAQVGGILIGDGANPQISLQLSAVDTTQILDKAASVDNEGSRRQAVRRLLVNLLEFGSLDEYSFTRELGWRSTKRRVDVVFANVSDPNEAPDRVLRAEDDRWKVVVDFPFDATGHSADDDLNRVERYREGNPPTRTICWLPSFLTGRRLRDLGTFVKLDHVLTGERFDEYASHLPQADRVVARGLLETQRDQLRNGLGIALEIAYGLRGETEGDESIDTGHELRDHFQSLDPSFTPRPPSTGFSGAFEALLSQAFEHDFPAHPVFGEDVTAGKLAKVLAELEAINAEPEPRHVVSDMTLRKHLRTIAQPLKFGTMHENAFVRDDFWRDHFERKIALEGGVPTVGRLRAWIDDPQPMGLPADVADLVIVAFANRTNRSFRLHGGPLDIPKLGSLPDDAVLQEQALPSDDEWDRAREYASAVFGLVVAKFKNATNVAALVAALTSAVAGVEGPVAELPNTLVATGTRVGEDASFWERTATATEAAQLVGRLRHAPGDDVVTELAVASREVHATAQAVARSIASAGDVAEALRNMQMWQVVEPAISLGGKWADDAARLRERLVNVLERDEFAIGLGPELAEIQSAASALLARAATVEPPPPPPPAPPPPPPPEHRIVRTLVGASAFDAFVDEVRDRIGPRTRVEITVDVLDDEPTT